MNLEQISSSPVVRAPRSCRLQQAAELMRAHHVGSLVVTDDAPNEERIVGFVTDRDLVLKAVAEGIGPADAMLADIMVEGLLTVARDADVGVAVETMRENGVRRLGVVDEDGVVIGFVSFDDVLAGVAEEIAGLAAILESEREREVEEGAMDADATEEVSAEVTFTG
ncbi:MAG TPA: CBS domain-containing protein [Burkholderiaceae bacterium]|nr:CBS domain-containing protein [Burkholderiaceae bacterium]